MRYSLAALPLAFAMAKALPGLPKLPDLPVPHLPSVPVFSVNGVPEVLKGNGVNSMAKSFQMAVGAMTVCVNDIAAINSGFTFDLSVNPTSNLLSTIDLAKSLHAASTIFWKLAVDTEEKLCSLVISITQQKIAAQQANLIAAFKALAKVVEKLKVNVQNSIATIQSQSDAFTDAERDILTEAFKILRISALASMGPASKFAGGMKAVGLGEISEGMGSLNISISDLGLSTGGLNSTPL